MEFIAYIFLPLIFFLLIVIFYLFLCYKHSYNRCLYLSEENVKLSYDCRNKDVALIAKIDNFKNKIKTINETFIFESLNSKIGKEFKDITTNIILNKINTTEQEFVGLLTDKVEEINRDVSFFLTDKIWDSFQDFKEESPDYPTILPNNTKAIYTKGFRTIVLIEQPPQARSILCTEDLVEKERIKIKAGNFYRYNLSFPYVYIFLIFDEGRFYSNKIYFRNKSLSSIREHVYQAPLPNIYETNLVCMGNDAFKDVINKESTIARQTNKVIAEFWNRAFNSHLGKNDNYVIDKKIENFSTWHENTEKDPFFSLGVNWKGGKTAKGIFEELLNNRPSCDLDYIDQEIKNKLEKTTNYIVCHVNESIENLSKIKITKDDAEELSQKVIKKLITNHIEKIFKKATDEIDL